MLGKTKKFYFERYAGIIDFLLSIDAGESAEIKNIGHSLDYHACVSLDCINTLDQLYGRRRTFEEKCC